MSEHRLAAVMVTDMVGFTALIGADQTQALEILSTTMTTLRDIVSRHRGDWLEDVADRSVTAFPSAVDAVECALEIQESLRDDPTMSLRIGIDIGDIVITGGHVYGDAVNIASFIERLADPQGLVITEAVYDSLHGKIELNALDLGDKILKNIDRPVHLYALTGRRPRSKFTNLVTTLFARRVPQFTGAYLAGSWALVEVIDWAATNQLLDQVWVYGAIAGFLCFVPSVVLLTYSHGAYGRDQYSRAEQIAVPINLVLAITVAYLVSINAPSTDRVEPVEPASVAVLPFVNLSDEEENDYLGMGLSEELINALAKVPGLYVASRTSSFSFDGPEEDLRDVARKLRVAAILEGSIRKQGNTIRITAQLIDGSNNYHIWSETYDRELEDVFEIQEEIAMEVSRKLVGVLQTDVFTAISEARAATLEAYDLYLRGLGFLRRPTAQDSLRNAEALFRQAIVEDPEFAQAHAAMCEVYLDLYIIEDLATLIEQAKPYCMRALQLDPGLREVRYALGELYRQTGDYEESAHVFRALLDDQPSARAWVGLAQTNSAKGDFDAARSAFGFAIDREPGIWSHRLDFAEFLYWQGDLEAAREQVQRVIELSPTNARAYLFLGAILDYQGDFEGSIEATLKSIELAPTAAAYRDLGLGYFYEQDFERARDALEKAVELSPENHWAVGALAQTLLFIDSEADAAVARFRQAAEIAKEIVQENDRDWVTTSILGMYTVYGGDREAGLQTITRALSNGGEFYEVQYNAALIYMYLDDHARALDAIEQCLANGAPVSLVSRSPFFADIMDDDRFKSLIKKNE